MSYFSDAHELVRYVYAANGLPGLRNSQIGAVHAISSHFTLRDQPGLVVLPTGAGKTAVLMLIPYVLRSERVLVITQSRFVRDQITQDFETLGTLKAVGALPVDLAAPKVYENTSVIRTAENWENLRQYDVVISTPNGASPGMPDVPTPPDNLFDLVLIDEAHHSPAPTWNALIEAFPSARCVLFTATPFRRDGKEIKARYLYTYPIQRAFDDEIYGEMVYIPVEPQPGTPPDVALAMEAEKVFLQDKEAQLAHALMVRVDSRPRANQLAEIYATHTKLRLDVLHSGKSQRATEKVVARLRAGELDGVICVNMLGEGFDLPNLKIAALHAPHRSLAITLQFFGRFARVNADRLGDAKFLAVSSEVDAQLSELFGESDAWGQRIRRIGQARIGEEVAVREFLDDFQSARSEVAAASFDDLSLYSFSVFNHVKIFQVHGDVNLHSVPNIRGFITEKVWVADPHSTTVFLVREEIRPTWSSTDGMDRIEHHLFVVYYDEQVMLLFICATHREEFTYKEVVAGFVVGHAQPLSLNKTSRVLRSFSDLELFNVGMRNRATGVVAESYRQLAGSAARHALSKCQWPFRLQHVGVRTKTWTQIETGGCRCTHSKTE